MRCHIDLNIHARAPPLPGSLHTRVPYCMGSVSPRAAILLYTLTVILLNVRGLPYSRLERRPEFSTLRQYISHANGSYSSQNRYDIDL